MTVIGKYPTWYKSKIRQISFEKIYQTEHFAAVPLPGILLSWSKFGLYSTMATTDEADKMATDEDKKEKDENGEQKVSPLADLSICANLQTCIYLTRCSVVHEAVNRFILFKSTVGNLSQMTDFEKSSS